MKRFFGMMPSNEIDIEKSYVDDCSLEIIIQSGCNGWTIIWADGATTYKDDCDSAQNNFDKAYKIAIENVGELKELSKAT